MSEKDIPSFKADIQEAFQKGFEDVYGKTDDTILPEKDIDRSLCAEGAAAYKAVVDGEIVGGAIVVIDEKTQHKFFVYGDWIRICKKNKLVYKFGSAPDS